jgi:5-formyltetrahydrofolate cyclo-ligase
VDLSDIDLFVIPGLAFDASGGRLGRGRGYYDATLLAAGPRAARVGLAFDFQVVTAVPAFEHDARVAALATEERWLEVTPS